MALKYAQQVALNVKERRRAELKRRRTELEHLPVTHRVDIELRNDLIREVDADLKQLDDDHD